MLRTARIAVVVFNLLAVMLLAGRLTAKENEASLAPSSSAATNSTVREVIVVCKTHFDIGYTHRVKDLIPYYRTTMIDRALAAMEATTSLPPEQQFAWTAPGWVMSKALEDWPGQTPERRARLDAAFQSGKFITHALPFTLESDACEPEEMARGLGFSAALSRKYGLPLARSGKMTDVPGQTAALATVLGNAGVKFMHIGCNWPSGFVRTPGLFWWEGPDGSRVLTLYSPIYGTCTALWPKQWLGKNDPGIGGGLLPPPDWKHRTWAAIIVTPDNSGPPKANEIRALFQDASRVMPGVTFRMGTLDDFANAILAENPNLPVVRGDMADTWIHGVMSDPGGIKLSRETHPLLVNAETLNTQLCGWKIPLPNPAQEVALGYEKMLLYGEHTWGRSPAINQYGDAFTNANPKTVSDLEASWEDKTDYIRDASRIARSLMATNLQSLATEVKCDQPGVVVYNPLPWPRSGWAEAGGITVFAREVPACGYLTCPLPPRSIRMAPVTSTNQGAIENEFFKITLDPAKGAMVSLLDKRTGREWVDGAAEHDFGQYLNERFTYEQTLEYTVAYQQGRAFQAFGAKGEWPHPGMHKPGMIRAEQTPYRAATPVGGKLTIDSSPAGRIAVLEMPADPKRHLPASALRVTLPNCQPHVDLEITIKDKARDNWPEADWLCFPFKLAHPQFRVARPLGLMDPTRDILPGANRHLYSVGLGVTLTDADGAGIAVCPIDHPLISLDTPGIWKFSMDFVPQKPAVYLNLYNNQWNTNFRYWYPGTWSSRIRLWTFDAKTPPEEVLTQKALEARNPLIAAVADGKGGTLPSQQTGLSVSRKGVLVTAFGANPDGAGTLLRVWEMAGSSGELTVTLPVGARFTTAQPVNLRGEKVGEPVTIDEGKIGTTLGPYAPASFILE